MKETEFGREELEMIYSPPQQRFEVNYDSFRDQGIWKILYQAQGINGFWSNAVFGEVDASGVQTDAIVRVNLNRSEYQIGDELLFSLTVNGKTTVDLYAVLIFPEKYFVTILYPLTLSFPKSIMPYQTSIELSSEQTFSILDIVLPKGLSKGTYTCFGIVTTSGSDPRDAINWIHFDFKTFEMK